MLKDNATSVLTRLINELNIPITKLAIKEELELHPDRDSLLAFSDVLNRWQVPNAAYQLSFDKLIDLPTPFIAFISKSKFTVVSHLEDNRVLLSNEEWNNKVFSIEAFRQLYSEFVFLVEPNNVSGEPNYKRSRRKELINELRKPVAFTGIGIIFFYLLFQHSLYFNTLNISIVLITLLKLTGIVITILLLLQSIDTNNPLIQKLCGGDNKNCNNILSSKSAKVTEELNWSEVGFFYFAATGLIMVFNSANPSVIKMLAVLNLISLPYTFYSFYYQWRVAKQWCVLCCSIQVLLWLEFFIFIPYLLHRTRLLTINDWCNLIIGLLVPIILWIYIKPYLLQSNQLKLLKQQLRMFKYNKEVFDKMLNSEIKYNLPSEEHSLIIGNRNAKHTITIVTSPYCQPCAKAHKELEWLDNREDINLQVVFPTINDTDKTAAIASHLLAIQSEDNAVNIKKAIHDMYKQKQINYDEWVKSYPIKSKIDSSQQLQKQRDWCKLVEIVGTPTLFINGRRFPKLYRIEDLKYFI